MALGIASGQRHETQLVEDTPDCCFVEHLPPIVIGDRAYDSGKLDQRLLVGRGVELIAPHHPRQRHVTQDGRPPRRYRQRWNVERRFGWLQDFRRIVARYERSAENFLGFLEAS
ncbi:MAG: transposase [Myxococcales bacterium FL481]|nr:MAG: transposase [Myxococcales bacterium FL481]